MSVAGLTESESSAGLTATWIFFRSSPSPSIRSTNVNWPIARRLATVPETRCDAGAAGAPAKACTLVIGHSKWIRILHRSARSESGVRRSSTSQSLLLPGSLAETVSTILVAIRARAALSASPAHDAVIFEFTRTGDGPRPKSSSGAWMKNLGNKEKVLS